MKHLIIILALLPSLALSLPVTVDDYQESQIRKDYGYPIRAMFDEQLLFMQKLEKAGYTKKQIIEIIKAHNVKPNKQ